MTTQTNTETANGGGADVFYLESSLPDGITIDEYRRHRPRRPRRWQQLKALAGLTALTPASAA
jgi:hypothetical protein